MNPFHFSEIHLQNITRIVTEFESTVGRIKEDERRISAPPICSITLLDNDSIDMVSIETKTDDVLIV